VGHVGLGIKKAVKRFSRYQARCRASIVSIAGLAVLWASLQTLLPGSAPALAAGDSERPVKIGVVTSLSGVAKSGGEQMVNGIKLYLDQIHNQMGGRKVELIVEDDEGLGPTAVIKMKKLVEQDKVDLLDGFLLGNVGYAVASHADKFKVPVIFVTAASDDVTQRQHPHWLIRTGYAASQPTHPFGEYVYKTLGYKKIATFGMDYPFGWETIGGFQQSYEQAGGKIIQKLWAPLRLPDFTPWLKRIDKNADALFLLTTVGAARVVAKEMKDMGLKIPIVAGGTSFDEDILPVAGDEALGAVSPLHWSGALDTPANKKFVQAYKAAYNADPNYYAEAGYTSAMWIAQAVNALKGNVSDKEKLLTALKNVSLKDAPRGPIKLDDFDNPIENVYVRKVERVNGKLQNTVIHTFPKVSQFWKWTSAEYLKQPLYDRDHPGCPNCPPSQ
jgi:branched-chain amino acid transport system substrate-binding protein